MSTPKDIEQLKSKFGEAILMVKEFRGEHTISVNLPQVHSLLKHCSNELGYDFLIDISSLDHFGLEPRFEMVYELTTVDDCKHLRVKCAIAEDEEVPSVVAIWKTADWHEREVYDMMGIRFSGHPDMRRILMWEGYPYYPLRKDFPLAGKETDMPDVAFTGVAPMEGGPFVTRPGTDRESGEPRAKGES